MNVSTLTVALASLMLVGCATAGPTRPPSVDVTGKWFGDFSGPWGSVGAIMTLQQTEAKVTGDLLVPGNSQFNSPVTGVVSGDVFTYRRVYGGSDVDLTVKENEMTGRTATGDRLVLRRQ